MHRFTTLLLIFSALLVLAAATPAAKGVAPTTRNDSLDAMLVQIGIEVKDAGEQITGTGLVALKNYSNTITGIIASKIGFCLQTSACQSITSQADVTDALGDIFIEVQTKIDEIIGAFGIVTWASSLLQMFLLPLITSLLTMSDLVVGSLGNGATFDSLLDLLDFGNLGNILGLVGLKGAGRHA